MIDVFVNIRKHLRRLQRRIGIALLLANGLARLRSAGEPVARENGFELAFSGHQRVHSHPVNKK